MTYTVQFEDVGSGNALGVYITDVLDPALDDTTLALNNMFSLVFSSGVPVSTTPATFPFSYDPQTRTVTLLAGNAGPNQGGSFVLQTRLKSTTLPGTIIPNQALVIFPNALQQVTPTNTIVSAVPLPTQLAYLGASSGTYLSVARLAAQLTAGSATVNAQPIGIQDFGANMTVLTNSSGTAAASVFLSSAAGNYNLGFSYAGDGFYYSPTTANPSFTVKTRATRLQAPFASARASDTVHLTLTLTDDRSRTLARQAEEPKRVFLEIINSTGTVTPLTSSLLSATTISFQFSLPQPLQLSWPLRARFGGDSRYAASISTGVLSLIDDVPPVITIASPHGGEVFTGSSLINISFSVTDESDPLPSATAFLVPLSGGQPVRVANGAAIPVSSLAPGVWVLRVNAVDWAGNASQATTPNFQVATDALPPRTALSIGTPSVSAGPAGGTLISGRTLLNLSSIDDLSVVGDRVGLGVAFQELLVDGVLRMTFANPSPAVGQVFSSSFTLAADSDGVHSLAFFAEDVVGNREAVQIATVTIDRTPPLALLLSPSSDARGADQIFGKGMIPVIGTVSDLNLQSWTLALASGANAQTGFSTLAASTLAVSASTMTVWNTTSLSGFFTLQLSAADTVANVTVTTATVFIGDPALLMVLQNAKVSHGGKERLENPSGIVVDALGRILVANTGHNEVIVFSSTGTVLASFDGRTAAADRKKPIAFDAPTGLALDTTGQIYVADRDNNRIAILSSTGTVVRSLGKRNLEGLFIPGSGPGEFNHPTGVAVSTDHIVVADRNNGRVQVFDLGGNFIFQIELSQIPPPSSDREDEDTDEASRDADGNDDNAAAPQQPSHSQTSASTAVPEAVPGAEAALPRDTGRDNASSTAGEVVLPARGNARSKPFGVAVDKAGNIYATDETTDRVQAFDRAGNPLYALGGRGALLGRFRDPKGVAVSGPAYIYAADANNHRIQKFDPFQNPALAFGPNFNLNRPVGVALDGNGNLYVTDRRNETILKFGLPASTATVIVNVPPARTAKRLVDAGGGRVQRDDGVRVDLPPGALDGEVEISIGAQQPRPPSEGLRMAGYLEQNKMAAASEGVEFGPEGTVFSKPVVVTLAYDPAGLPQGVKESDLKVYYWNAGTLAWERMESSVDTSSQTVSAVTSHFSLYRVFAPNGPPAAADPTFRIGDVFVFPNPARGGAKPAFHVEVGIADSVQIKVYSVSGRPVMETELSGMPLIIDSGAGPRYAYEHAWDGHIASGVYLYVVTAKSGGAKLTKTGKCAVVR